MKEFNVEGMSCQHCVDTVTRSVLQADEDAKVVIDLQTHRVSIDSAKPESTLRAAIEAAGYAVVGV